jgi:hypothetical protein
MRGLGTLCPGRVGDLCSSAWASVLQINLDTTDDKTEEDEKCVEC